MKKIFIGLWMCCMLLGCGNKVDYERSTEMGTISQITMDDVAQKMENNETFMFVFTQETCENCIGFKENVLSDYIKEHGFEFNEVVLSLDMDSAPVFDFVKEHPNPKDQLEEGFTEYDVLTPTFYFIEDGEVKDIFIGGKMDKKTFDSYIIKYHLDEVK
ncbi:MAG: hypothetical protein ACI4U3_10110 [Traorella sp.]